LVLTVAGVVINAGHPQKRSSRYLLVARSPESPLLATLAP